MSVKLNALLVQRYKLAINNQAAELLTSYTEMI